MQLRAAEAQQLQRQLLRPDQLQASLCSENYSCIEQLAELKVQTRSVLRELHSSRTVVTGLGVALLQQQSAAAASAIVVQQLQKDLAGAGSKQAVTEKVVWRLVERTSDLNLLLQEAEMQRNLAASAAAAAGPAGPLTHGPWSLLVWRRASSSSSCWRSTQLPAAARVCRPAHHSRRSSTGAHLRQTPLQGCLTSSSSRRASSSRQQQQQRQPASRCCQLFLSQPAAAAAAV